MMNSLNSILLEGTISIIKPSYFILKSERHFREDPESEVIRTETYYFKVIYADKELARRITGAGNGRKVRVVGRLREDVVRNVSKVTVVAEHIDVRFLRPTAED